MAGRARILADFEGLWTLERRITGKDQPAAHFAAKAEWQAVPGGMRYFEQGELVIAGHPPVQAERRYFWHEDLSVAFSVNFEDGRLFHRVPARGGATTHWCDPDRYDGRYEFANWPRFKVVWRVRGPVKDYTMVSDYTRP